MVDNSSSDRPVVVVTKPLDLKNSGVIVSTVRVMHFRCLRSVEVPLGQMTVLIGENNVGKTSFLDALHAAIGIGPRHFNEEDIWLDTAEKHPPKSRSIIIDMLIRPVDADLNPIKTFPSGSPWLDLWGNGIQQDDNDCDFAAIRTSFSWSQIKNEYVAERRFLRDWPLKLEYASMANLVERIPPVSAAQSLPISLYLLDAKRDGADDIKSRNSIWHKLVSDPGLSDENVEQIEKHLTDINELFVRESKILAHVKQHLSCVGDVVNCDKDGVAIDPVARRLRDLVKGMDVILSTAGASAFPLARQGMGTRSLASVLFFRAYMSWRQSTQKTDAIHPFLAIEEPETHLHPHAQRALLGQIQQIPGQKIISTHSPYICSHANIRSFLHFGKDASETKIDTFDMPGDDLTPEEMRRISREVMNTRGDLLFSRYIVLFEGETEEQALPAFAKEKWGVYPHEMGISFVAVNGAGGYTPFLRLAIRFGIPWCVFGDGAANEIKDLNGCLRRALQPEHPGNSRVFVIPNGMNFEAYVASPSHLPFLCEMIADVEAEENGINDRGKAALLIKLNRKTAAEIADDLAKRKTTYAPRIAAAYSKHADQTQRIPPLLQTLLDYVVPPGSPALKT